MPTALDRQYPSVVATDTATNEHATQSILSDWLATIDDDFAFSRQLVEHELQVDLDKVKLQLVDDSTINKEVAIETRRLVNKQFGRSAFADHFLQEVMNPLAGTYAALYSSRLQSILISRSMLRSYAGSVAESSAELSAHPALLTLLIHELVHAADDQRYRIHENRALDFRASFAQSATFEGHAQWVTRKLCELSGCSSGLDALDAFMFNTNQQSDQFTQPVEAISRSVLEYSYVEGERFIDALARRDNGMYLIDKLLSTPPLDPIQILSPESYPDNARETRNQYLASASRNIEHPWTQTPWIGVETSPLKGIDLRADPQRRQAAVDGFTKLITAMISMQFYDQGAPGALPMESTILQAESAQTARMFARMLHANTQQPDAQMNEESVTVSTGNDSASLPIHIYRTKIDGEIDYKATIAVSGRHVIQIAGNTTDPSPLEDYAVKVLMNLETP